MNSQQFSKTFPSFKKNIEELVCFYKKNRYENPDFLATCMFWFLILVYSTNIVLVEIFLRPFLFAFNRIILPVLFFIYNRYPNTFNYKIVKFKVVDRFVVTTTITPFCTCCENVTKVKLVQLKCIRLPQLKSNDFFGYLFYFIERYLTCGAYFAWSNHAINVCDRCLDNRIKLATSHDEFCRQLARLL